MKLTPGTRRPAPAIRRVHEIDADEERSALDRWLRELERLDAVLHAQAEYLDAVESGLNAAPPAPFVGTPDLPDMPATLSAYARELVARNDAVTRRAVDLSAQLRPRNRRPLHQPTPSARGGRFELQA
jgi:hypothetical protein